MKIDKKSQITIFIIAGITIFVAAGIVIYLANELKTRKETGFSDPSPITSYSNECLKRFTERGIELLSRQSGYLYFSQGGSTIDALNRDEGKLFLNYNNKPVRYIIKRAETKEEYPWKFFPNYLGMQSYKFSIGASSMQTKRQMEQQLEFFVENKMSSDCGFTNDFKEYEINHSKPKATVTITNREVHVALQFPMEITESATGKNYKPRYFYVTEKSGLGRLYDAARIIADKDSQDFLFNLTKTSQLNGMPVTVIRDVYKKDDVIVIQDPETGLNFMMARQNRRPALSYHACPHPNIEQIKAYDPDEDELTMTLDGNAIITSDGEFFDSQEC